MRTARGTRTRTSDRIESKKMLKRLIAFSLNNAALVLVLSALVVAFAAYQVPRMPVDVFPDLNAPTVVVMSEARGFSADEVEQYVTFPIESAVNRSDKQTSELP